MPVQLQLRRDEALAIYQYCQQHTRINWTGPGASALRRLDAAIDEDLARKADAITDRQNRPARKRSPRKR